MSVAVAIDKEAAGNAQDLAAIQALVSAAVGADPAQGDVVTVKSREFSPAEIAEPQIWETPWFATILRNVVALLSVVLVLLLAVRPLLKALTRKGEAAAGGKAGAGAGAAAAEAEDGATTAEDGDTPVRLTQGNTPPVPEELAAQVEAARRIVREQPDDAVQALRRMLREPPPAPEPEAEAA